MKIIFTIALMALLTVEVHAQQWPTFRRDVARSGRVTESLDASRLELAWEWQSELPPTPAWDGPARWDAYNQIRDLPAMRQYDACFHPVSDGKSVFFGSSSQDALISLDLESGNENWAYVAGGPIRLAPSIAEDKILFGSDDGNAYCLDKATGSLIWKFNPAANQAAEQRRLINNDRLISYYPIRTGITVSDGIAYFGASFLPWRESFLCAVNLKSGKPEGPDTFVSKHDNATLEGSLLVAENRLIVPQGRVAPLLFDRQTGKSLGSLPGGGGVTIVLTESGDIVRAEGGGAARAGQVGVFRGKQRVASFPRGRAIVVQENDFFVINGQKIFAAARETNELRWQREIDEPLEIIMAGQTLFVGGRDHVTAVDAKSGNVIWSSVANGRVFGLAVAGEKLIASTDSGHIHVFAATSAKQWTAGNLQTGVQNWNSPNVLPIRDRNLLHRWVFHRSAMSGGQTDLSQANLDGVQVKDQAGSTSLPLQGTATSIQVGDSENREAIAMTEARFVIDEAAEGLPTDAITVEAWVRVDEAQQWGGIVGCIQDDGSTEHGWLLGFRDDKFSFAIAGTGTGLSYVTASESFEPGSWNHVVGTYNGHESRLYVNGSLAQSSTAESGPINYAKKRFFTVGAYRDANEDYPLSGALHEIRIHAQALDATSIAKSFQLAASDFPISQSNSETADSFLTWGPVANYQSAGVVEISYGTKKKCSTVIDLITGSGVTQTASNHPTLEHKIVVSDLPFRRESQFQIKNGTGEEAESTTSFSLDTHFDWAGVEPKPPSDIVAKLMSASPNPSGLAIVVGAEQAEFARQLANESKLSVVLLVKEETDAADIRSRWWADPQTRYGTEICVTATPTAQLPAAFASVVVTNKNDDNLRRLVRPEGGILHDTVSVTWKREPIKGSGVWSHMYGQADNSAFGGESLSQASTREDLMTQWIGRPGPRYQTDRQNRKPSPLAVGGRLFLQGQQRIISLDSFSGSILWSVETPTIMRWNVPHDCSNWCADESGVFVAADNRAWLMDGRSGEVIRQFELPIDPNSASARDKDWGFIARHGDQLIGTVVAKDAVYKKWWGKSQWFDSTGGEDTHVVAGDSLFALDCKSGELNWKHEGLILHPTITIIDGNAYFIEDKTPAHLTSSKRRISLDEDQSHELVCVDMETGETEWRKPLATFAGHLASFYLAGGGNQESRCLVLVASESTKKEFSIHALKLNNGDTIWHRNVAWEATHHGKHISRPAIEGELLYVRPEVLNLANGETIRRGFPGGHGCSSYTLSTNGMFSRLGETTWWDVRKDKVNRFQRIRTDCWISVVPAQGMLLSAEGGGGCSCGIWLETSLGFLPRSVDEDYPGK